MATRLPRNRVDLTVSEIAQATGGVLAVPGTGAPVTSVSTNTRELEPGAVFVALTGLVHDGHDHVRQAAAAGATVAVVERDVDAPPTMSLVRVGSTLRALGDLAAGHVRRWHEHAGRVVIGITGSAGKTTTRVATSAILEKLFPGELLATRGNLNNRIGVPMMLLSLAPEHRVVVLELGTSEPGEIAELCRIARPDVGILTLIAAAHVEGLGSIDGVADEKAALFRSLSRDGIAVGNGDDARVHRALEATECTRVTYGRTATADLRVAERTPIGMTRSSVVLAGEHGRQIAFETPLVGEAGALACAAAIAAVEAAFHVRLEGDWLTDAFDDVQVGEGAQRLVPLALGSGLAVIDDTYNANPASMASSIRAAGEMARVMNRTLVLVLGEMRELGSEAARGHEEVGHVAAEAGARLVLAVGGGETRRIADTARHDGANVVFLPSVDEGLSAIVDAVRVSDLVLVKGSRSSGTDRVVAELEQRNN